MNAISQVVQAAKESENACMRRIVASAIDFDLRSRLEMGISTGRKFTSDDVRRIQHTVQLYGIQFDVGMCRESDLAIYANILTTDLLNMRIAGEDHPFDVVDLSRTLAILEQYVGYSLSGLAEARASASLVFAVESELPGPIDDAMKVDPSAPGNTPADAPDSGRAVPDSAPVDSYRDWMADLTDEEKLGLDDAGTIKPGFAVTKKDGRITVVPDEPRPPHSTVIIDDISPRVIPPDAPLDHNPMVQESTDGPAGEEGAHPGILSGDLPNRRVAS